VSCEQEGRWEQGGNRSNGPKKKGKRKVKRVMTWIQCRIGPLLCPAPHSPLLRHCALVQGDGQEKKRKRKPKNKETKEIMTRKGRPRGVGSGSVHNPTRSFFSRNEGWGSQEKSLALGQLKPYSQRAWFAFLVIQQKLQREIGRRKARKSSFACCCAVLINDNDFQDPANRVDNQASAT